jgi:hypothetical protein
MTRTARGRAATRAIDQFRRFYFELAYGDPHRFEIRSGWRLGPPRPGLVRSVEGLEALYAVEDPCVPNH